MPLSKLSLISTFLSGVLAASVLVGQDTGHAPRVFGTDQYNVTTISAVSFTPHDTVMSYNTSPGLARFGNPSVLNDFYVGVDLPGGAVIDYIGVNSLTDIPFGVGADLLVRNLAGSTFVEGSVNSAVHGGAWGTDFNPSPLGYTWPGVSGEALILHVQTAPAENFQYFGWVEIWWKRAVSPAPGVPSFGDVPIDHPFFQFIEALKASGITGGCGSGNFCPDAPVTRGQMATFLAKALGLHWPGPGGPPSLDSTPVPNR
jgi:hypothetical protein